MVVVVPAGARRRQARKARPGRRGPCGGRAAHHAIVAMCDTADSLTWRVLERLFMCWATFIWSHSVWSPSAVHVSSAVCGKSSSSAEPWRGNSLAAVVRQPPQPSRKSSALGSVTKCGGRKSYDQRAKSRSKYFIFFGHFSRRCQLRTSRTCSKVNSRSVVSDLSLLDRRPLCPRLNKHRRMSDVTVNGGSLTCHVEGISQTVSLAVSAEQHQV